MDLLASDEVLLMPFLLQESLREGVKYYCCSHTASMYHLCIHSSQQFTELETKYSLQIFSAVNYYRPALLLVCGCSAV